MSNLGNRLTGAGTQNRQNHRKPAPVEPVKSRKRTKSAKRA